MTKRKVLSLFTAVVLTLSLSACSVTGLGDAGDSGGNPTGVMNTPYKVGDWEINVKRAEFTDIYEIENSEYYFVPNDGNTFIIIYLTACNKSDAAAKFVPMLPEVGINMSLDIGADMNWQPSDMTLYVNGVYKGRADILNTTAEPGETLDGVAAFEVETAVAEAADSVLDLYFADNGEKRVYDLRAS